jgi:hypothetical protein
MSAIFDGLTRDYLLLIAEGAGPAADYPIAKILHTAGPDQMYMWNRMIKRHNPSSWGAAHTIYANSAKKHGVDPWGTSNKLGKEASATWGKGTKKYAGPGSLGHHRAAPAAKPAAAAAGGGGDVQKIAAKWLQSPHGSASMTALMHSMLMAIEKEAPGTDVSYDDVAAALKSALGKKHGKVAA